MPQLSRLYAVGFEERVDVRPSDPDHPPEFLSGDLPLVDELVDHPESDA